MKKIILNLRLFDGTGASAGTGGDGLGQGDVNMNTQDANVENNNGAEVVVPSEEERKTKFENLIKGEFKDLFSQRTQEIINNRFKETKQYESQLQSLSPVLQMLSGRYGIDATDINALTNAIQQDTSFYEQEAMDKGMTVEQLMQFKSLERENAEFRRMQDQQIAQEQADKTFQKWMADAEELKKSFPNFDINVEMQNQDFLGMLKNGIPLQHAYKVLHMDEIMGGAMQYAVEQTKEKVVNNILAKGNRPTENGVKSNGGTATKKDISQLSKQEIEDIERRVARGEKITF